MGKNHNTHTDNTKYWDGEMLQIVRPVNTKSKDTYNWLKVPRLQQSFTNQLRMCSPGANSEDSFTVSIVLHCDWLCGLPVQQVI